MFFYISNFKWHRSFCIYVKFSEKLTFTPDTYQRVRNVSFSENFVYLLNELSHPYSTSIDTICTKRHLGNLFGHKDESTKFWQRFLSKSPEENRQIFCNFYLPSSHQVLLVVTFIEIESGFWLCSKDQIYMLKCYMLKIRSTCPVLHLYLKIIIKKWIMWLQPRSQRIFPF